MAAEGGGVSWKKGVGSRMGCEVSSRKEGAHLAPAYVMAQRKHSQVSLTHGGCDSALFSSSKVSISLPQPRPHRVSQNFLGVASATQGVLVGELAQTPWTALGTRLDSPSSHSLHPHHPGPPTRALLHPTLCMRN